jgi:hypothetical protein
VLASNIARFGPEADVAPRLRRGPPYPSSGGAGSRLGDLLRAAHEAAPILPSGCARSLKTPGEAHPVVSACDALALIPIARAAFSYQPKDLKSVRRTLRNRFPLGKFFRRDLLSTLRDTLRFTIRLPGREALFLVAPWRHQINGGSSRQGKRINPRWRNAWRRAPRAAEQGATAAC